MPFGVPSSAPGGTAGHYRDNRVRYLFAHVDEFVAAGGLGAVFGVGAANQTYITTDGNQFRNAVAAYFASPTPLPPAGPPSGPGNFFTLAPCRVFDTRGSAGPYGGPALAAAERRVFALAGRCSIPASARAVTLNLTVTQPSAPGNIQLFPSGLQVPTTSTLNYVGGQTRANTAIVGLSASGALTVRSGQASGSAHVILDVTGYFE